MKLFFKILFSISISFMLLMQLNFLRISNIYFFDGVYILIFICLMFYFLLRNKVKNILVIVISVFSINFGFFVLFPVSFERSVSVGLLNNLSEYSETQEFSEQDITREILKITSTEQFTNKRIEEQLYTGYLELQEGKYILSQNIKTYLFINKLMSQLYDFEYDS